MRQPIKWLGMWLWFCGVLLSLQTAYGQSSPENTFKDKYALRNYVFGKLDTANFPSGILWDRSEMNSRLPELGQHDAPILLTLDDWYMAYYELEDGRNKPGTDDAMIAFYEKLKLKVNERSLEDNVPVIPIGVLMYQYHTFKTDAIEQGHLKYNQGTERLEEATGVSTDVYDEKIAVAVTPLMDAVKPGEVRFVLDREFFKENVGEDLAGLDIDLADGQGFRYLAWGEEVVVSYAPDQEVTIRMRANVDGDTYLFSHPLVVTPYESPESAVTFDSEFTIAVPTVIPTQYSALHLGFVLGKVGVKYGCADKKVRKPVILVTGFTPQNVGTVPGAFLPEFITSTPSDKIEGYNTNGFVDMLVSKGYDVYIIVWDNGDDHVVNNSALLEQLIKTINQDKAANDSHFENIIVSWSLGALTARHTLLKMEKDFYDGTSTAHHHSRIYFSIEGEHQGANVPLGAQHATNPSTIGGAALSGILNSPTSTEILMYHFSQTGTAANPGQGPHPNRIAYLAEMGSQEHNFVKTPGNPYPSTTRNVGISVGSNQGNGYGIPAGTQLYQVNRVNVPGVRRTYWSVGPNTEVFRLENRNFVWQNWSTTESRVTNGNALAIDNAAGSYGGVGSLKSWHNIVATIMTANPLNLNWSWTIAKDCFNPTIGALDIRETGELDLSYDIRDLLFVSPTTSGGDKGFPHHKKPNYAATPFDAILAPSSNDFHDPGPTNSIWEGFLEDEIMPDNLELQNRRVGESYSQKASGLTYRADFEALATIEAGKALNQRTPQQDFVIQDNARVRMRAGNSITFKPGFEADEGSYLYAEINNSCAGGYNGNRSTPPAPPTGIVADQISDDEYPWTEEKGLTQNPLENIRWRIAPNPANDQARIQIQLEAPANLQITIRDMNGRIISSVASGQDFYAGFHQVEVSTAQLASGLYMCELLQGPNRYVQKLVVSH
ncbi:MAG: T9SS type A sorting domain-containing protein [Bacteroidota bacterium]